MGTALETTAASSVVVVSGDTSRAATMAAHEAWALRESRTYDGFAEMTALGISGLSVSRALDAAEVAWRKSKQAPK